MTFFLLIPVFYFIPNPFLSKLLLGLLLLLAAPPAALAQRVEPARVFISNERLVRRVALVRQRHAPADLRRWLTR